MTYGNELKQLQIILTQILSDITKVCEENDIEYFIIGGTALGAIRHTGFIPWDDDIDIGMTRSNYNKFIKIAPEKLPPHLFVQNPDTEPGDPFVYTKVRMNSTKFVEYCNRNVKMHQGAYVDIFAFDEVSDDETIFKKQWENVQKAVKIFAWRFVPDLSEKPNSLKTYIKWIIKKIVYFLMHFRSGKKIIDNVIEEQSKYNGCKSKAICNTLYPVFKRDYFIKEELYPLKKYKFENIEVYGAGDIDAYLKNMYGNYMELPPEDKRYGHKPYLFDISNK